MASFNLGRIKGDKGEKGDTGAKGDTGEKGEKGDTGEKGKDGITPVLSIGETQTLSPSEEAHVELDNTDAQNPVLSFYIPRGRDGRDALGDMLSAFYDTEGKKEDIYKYADSLFGACLKKEGGTLLGALKASGADGKEAVMRNISIRTSLPEDGVEGDICIIVESENAKKLGDCEIGSTMLIEEHEGSVEYIIVAKDYHSKDTVTLVRKGLASMRVYFDYFGREEYSRSDIDNLLEVSFKEKFSKELKKHLVCVPLNVTDSRHCFLLSLEELQKIEYFKTPENRIASYSTTKEEYFTRSTTSDKVYVVTSTGSFALVPPNTAKNYRPAIVLTSSLAVENAVLGDVAAVKMASIKRGIYVFFGGEWKECASL